MGGVLELTLTGNQYGRKEELYECEDCSGCPYAKKCKKTDKNRTVRINQELTSIKATVGTRELSEEVFIQSNWKFYLWR